MKNGKRNSEPIPVDLIIEIFLRVPVKSIGRGRCVSKQWAFMLSRPDFTDLILTRSLASPQVLLYTELYLTRSLARPQILFACQNNGELFYFSSPQPQNLDENTSTIATTLLTRFPLNPPYEICSHVHGLVCYTHKQTIWEQVICNPSTGRSINLPQSRRNSFFGYDPINKQFKVLYRPSISYTASEVMTLGTGELSWRMIECNIPHSSLCNGICINGVLYYTAIHMDSQDYVIICFDVRLEKFSFIDVRSGTLVNYNGKLGLCWCETSRCIYGGSKRIELWVLEDLEKQEWSKHSYVLPASWKSLVGNLELRFVGVTRTNEVVLTSNNYQTDPFYLFYFNLERNALVRVEIQGIASKYYSRIDTILDNVERM